MFTSSTHRFDIGSSLVTKADKTVLLIKSNSSEFSKDHATCCQAIHDLFHTSPPLQNATILQSPKFCQDSRKIRGIKIWEYLSYKCVKHIIFDPPRSLEQLGLFGVWVGSRLG